MKPFRRMEKEKGEMERKKRIRVEAAVFTLAILFAVLAVSIVGVSAGDSLVDTYNRQAAYDYAQEYWDEVCSDGYFWNTPSTYISLESGTDITSMTGYDCAHFVSCCIGSEPNEQGGGLDVPSRVSPTYGEPGAAKLGDWLIESGNAVEKTSIDELEKGDVINYDWDSDGHWNHIALYLGNGKIAAHTICVWNEPWELGTAHHRLIHIEEKTDQKMDFIYVLDNNDRLSVINASSHEIVNTIDGLNINETIGGWRAIATYTDGTCIVAEFAARPMRLSRWDAQGKCIFSIEMDIYAVDVSENGYIYALNDPVGTIYGNTTVILDGYGNLIEEAPFGNVDIVVDDKFNSVWIVGADIKRMDKNLTLLFSIDPIEWSAVSVDFTTTGDAWVAERKHSDVPESKNRLLKISPNGEIVQSIACDFYPSCLSVDRTDDSIWVSSNKLYKFSSNGTKILEIESGKGWSVKVDNGDRSVWLAGYGNVRHYTKDGILISSISGFLSSQAYVTLQSWVSPPEEEIFDTGAPANPYPSIMGNHTGTIKPNNTVIATKLYTYPCVGTGGHTEYARIWNSTWNATATWEGYVGDWHNISFDKTVVLLAGESYNYTIHTGSYPQIIHESPFNATGGTITCDKFVDANGRIYYDWILAIKLFL